MTSYTLYFTLSLFLGNWGSEGNDISARTGADLTLGLPDPESVNQMLQERFFLTQEEQIPSFHDFLQWHDERHDEWYDRWNAERSRTDKSEQSDDLFRPEDDLSLL